jgi:RNA polymerase sigma-70 factor (ECF subfamily)
MIKNYHTAEDIAQDTFIDGYIKIKSLCEPYNVGAWLVKIAKNKCYNYLTRSNLRFESELHDYIPNPTSTPEDLLIDEYDRKIIGQALNKLPDLHKNIAVLYYFDNQSHKKISELLQIPIGTVKSRLYEARLKLKKELDNMDINEKVTVTVSEDFEKQVKEKIDVIRNYYHKNNFSFDGLDDAVKETVELIDQLPESKDKHAKYTDVYRAAIMGPPIYLNYQEYIEKGMQEAEISENAQAIADFIAQTAMHNPFNSKIEKIEDAIIHVKNMPDHKNALGQLYYYRGMAIISNPEEALEYLRESMKTMNKTQVLQGSALSAIKMLENKKTDGDMFHDMSMYGCDQHHFKDGKFGGIQWLMFQMFNSPPYTSQELSSYVINRFDAAFCNEEPGAIKESDIPKPNGTTITLISKNEKISVLAGEFDDCIHIEYKSAFKPQNLTPFDKESDQKIIKYTVHAYYAKNIGVVKTELIIEGQPVQNYELYEYKINEENAGPEYTPLAEGNLWKYRDTNLSMLYWQSTEREIVSVSTNEYGQVVAILAKNEFSCLKKIDSFNDECDSDTYIKLASSTFFKSQKDHDENINNAIRHLKYAVQKNSSAKAGLMAFNAIKFIEKYKKDKEKYYHFPQTNMESRIIYKNKEKDIIKHDNKPPYYVIHPSHNKDWNLLGSNKKVTGITPFDILQRLAETLYSEKWVDGYSEQKPVEQGDFFVLTDINGKQTTFKAIKGDLSIKAENVGTVKVKAGTFENCLKVTFDLKQDEQYYKNFSFDLDKNFFPLSNYGIKIFWSAPNVGIIKHDCIWDESLSSSCELTEYTSSATEGEYMPIYVNNRWLYEETTLEPIFKATKEYNIVSGIEDEFFIIESQEFMYLGTEEEYEEYKKSCEPTEEFPKMHRVVIANIKHN